MSTTARRDALAGRSTSGVLAAVLSTVLIVSGCSAGQQQSDSADRRQDRQQERAQNGRKLTPAAEPGKAPKPQQPPAGEVIELPDGNPWGVAADAESGVVATALRSPARLALVDMRTRQVRVMSMEGSARMLDVVKPGGPLLYPAETANTLFEVALPSGRVLDRFPTGQGPHEATRVGDTTFVADEFGNRVSVIRGGRIVETLPEPVQPGGITSVAGRVAVVDVQANTLWVYDAETLRLVASLPAGAGPSHVKPVGGSRVAVSDVRGNAVMTYDLSGKPRRLDRIDVSGRAFGLKTDPKEGIVYTTLANVNKVVKLRVAPGGSLRKVTTLPTVRQPNSLAVNVRTDTVYVAGYTNSQLQVIPQSAFRER